MPKKYKPYKLLKLMILLLILCAIAIYILRYEFTQPIAILATAVMFLGTLLILSFKVQFHEDKVIIVHGHNTKRLRWFNPVIKRVIMYSDMAELFIDKVKGKVSIVLNDGEILYYNFTGYAQSYAICNDFCNIPDVPKKIHY